MGKREIVQKRRQQASKTNLVPFVIIGIFAVVIVGMIILIQTKPKPNVILPDRTTTAEKNGLILGNPNAPVTVVEFADFQCPACANYWSQLEPTIIKNYVETGKIQYVYSPFSFLGTGSWDESKKSAEAAYCANDQQKFWEYHDVLFANHNGENQGTFSRTNLLAFADKLSLNMTEFKDCLDTDKYAEKVADSTAYAQQQGATYTPSFLIDGQIVNANDLVGAIDAALAK